MAEIIIGKQRNGPVGKVDLTYINKFTRFENAEKRVFLRRIDGGNSKKQRSARIFRNISRKSDWKSAIAEMEKLFAIDQDPIVRVRIGDARQKLNQKAGSGEGIHPRRRPVRGKRFRGQGPGAVQAGASA